MLGLERATDLPPSTLMAFGSDFTYPGSTDPEPIFPGNHDILHGLYLHRADSNDIDLYKFVIGGGQEGLFTAETFAERQPNSSLLDSHLMLYRENADGSRELIARNDDYYSEDSYIELRLGAGTYFLGVTASGNDAYNAEFEDTGFGGRSQGVYDLRVDFRPDVAAGDAMRDVSDTGQPGTFLDGDADGVPGGTYNFWFRAVDLSKTIIVDKLNRPFEPGIKARFGNIASALQCQRSRRHRAHRSQRRCRRQFEHTRRQFRLRDRPRTTRRTDPRRRQDAGRAQGRHGHGRCGKRSSSSTRPASVWAVLR